MGLSLRKLKPVQRRLFLPGIDFNLKMPTLQVQSSGSILAGCELGLSANADSATLQGGTTISAIRTLTTNPCGVYCSTLGTAAIFQRVYGSVSDSMTGWLMSNQNAIIGHVGNFHKDWDDTEPLSFRVHYTTDSPTPSESAAVILRLEFPVADTEWSVSTPDTQDTLSLTPNATAFSHRISAWTSVALWQSKVARIRASEACLLTFLRSGASTITNDVWILGLEFKYYPATR